MKRLLLALALLFPALAHGQEGFIVRDNCTTLSAPTINTRCLQRTTTSGFSAGTMLRYNGAAWEQADPRRGGCTIVIGSDAAGSTALANADLTQGNQCQVPQPAVLLEIAVSANAGTPNVIVGRFRPNGGTSVNLLTSALATGASGAVACSRASAGTSLNGTTSCSGTLQNTTLNAGDWIYLVSGTAGGTATRMTISVSWTW